jgi:hypothetical protein
VPRISDTNFLNNTCAANDGLLSVESVGFAVDHCIFSGNTREFYMSSANPASGFVVTNCVFSGALPTEEFYNATANNLIETQTASFPFLYFATQYCPNALAPAQTPDLTTEATQTRATPEATPGETASDSSIVPIVVGAVGGVVLLAVVAALVICKLRARTKAGSSLVADAGDDEEEAQQPAIETIVTTGAFDTQLGLETENPVAQTIAPAFESDVSQDGDEN